MIRIKQITIKGIEISEIDEIKQLRKLAQAKGTSELLKITNTVAEIIAKAAFKDKAEPKEDEVPDPTVPPIRKVPDLTDDVKPESEEVK